MKRILVSDLAPGMELSEDVFDRDGNMLLTTGDILTPQSISRLRRHGVVVVSAGPTSSASEQQINAASTYLNLDSQYKPLDLLPQETRGRAISCIRKVFFQAAQRQDISLSPDVQETTAELVHYLTRHKRLIQSVLSIRRQDEYLLEHSVNVCALSIMTGACLGLGKDDLYHLGICGLLHDIGKIMIPPAVLNKPGRLSRDEYSIVQQHTLYARDLLRYDPLAAMVASQHHERFDGSGYPYGLAASKINLFAQIVGLVDVYDALSVDRCYRKACPLREVVELLAASGNYHFEYRVVKAFLENITPFPIGTKVRLSNGHMAVVIKSSSHFPIYPTVALLTDSAQTTPAEIDLYNDRTGLYILGSAE